MSPSCLTLAPSLSPVPHHVRVFAVCAFGFVLLGVGTSLFGVAWPSVADDLDRSIGELGYVTLAYGSGYTLSSLVSGRLSARSSVGALLLTAAMTAAMALALLAVSPGWIIFLSAAAIVGAASGQIDSATNAYVAVRHGSRAMGLIHGAFGIGAIIGPLIITVLLYLGLSWRFAFGIMAAGQLIYAAGLWAFARSVAVPTDSDEPHTSPSHLRSATLAWSIVVFFLYAGVASGFGAWSFTYLTEERGLSDTAGGLVVTAYFVGFTGSRLLLGVAGDRFEPSRLLRWSSAATVAGAAVFWWAPAIWVGVVALVFTGFAHGPIFPMEMTLTAERFGAALAATVVGFEIAAANVGFASVPGLIGLFVDRYGLASIPPALFVAALLVWAAIERLHSVSSGAEAVKAG